MPIVDDRYPHELEDTFNLTESVRIRVRALHKCEDAPIRELFSRLSMRSRYLRFFSPLHTLPEPVVQRLACGDYARELALVAEYRDGNATEVIGLATFGAADDEHAEVSLVIRDDWQGQHVGTELARRLLEAAQARGFRRFIAYVATGNLPIRRIIDNLGTTVSAKMDRGISEVAFAAKHAR